MVKWIGEKGPPINLVLGPDGFIRPGPALIATAWYFGESHLATILVTFSPKEVLNEARSSIHSLIHSFLHPSICLYIYPLYPPIQSHSRSSSAHTQYIYIYY